MNYAYSAMLGYYKPRQCLSLFYYVYNRCLQIYKNSGIIEEVNQNAFCRLHIVYVTIGSMHIILCHTQESADLIAHCAFCDFSHHRAYSAKSKIAANGAKALDNRNFAAPSSRGNCSTDTRCTASSNYHIVRSLNIEVFLVM